jgi:hypothetical protein
VHDKSGDCPKCGRGPSYFIAHWLDEPKKVLEAISHRKPWRGERDASHYLQK